MQHSRAQQREQQGDDDLQRAIANSLRDAAAPVGPPPATRALRRSVDAWNMDGSSDAQAESGSWLRDAEEATGRLRGRCSFDGCPNQAEVGGHVWIRGEGCFIAPICRPCNRFDNPERMQGAGARLRANIEVTRTAMTEGMRNAERRIAVGGGGGRSGNGWGAKRECQACAEDIADRPESHQLCRGCYSSRGGNSFHPPLRACQECGTDIGDQPASHTRCFGCFGFPSRGSGAHGGSSCGRSAPRRECRGCGTDISDRPASHSMCLECFRGGGRGGV